MQYACSLFYYYYYYYYYYHYYYYWKLIRIPSENIQFVRMYNYVRLPCSNVNQDFYITC